MEELVPSKRGDWQTIDPHHYLRAADRALADGDLDQALTLIVQTYLAFDLCWPGQQPEVPC